MSSSADAAARAHKSAALTMQQALILLGLIVLGRFVVGGVLPLSSDEAYYWLWSRHLAWGYLDHPPAVAWLISIGTILFGDTSFGVRFGAIAASMLATLLVWRAAADLLDDERGGVRAALWFSLSLMVSVEMLAATPDAPAACAAAALLYALVKLQKSANGRWWLVAGAALGFGFLSKLTALFLLAGVFLWVIGEAGARRWLCSPWLYAGLAVALLVALPNVLWNLSHDQAMWRFQFGRVTHGSPSYRYLPEFLGAQIGLVSPLVFILGGVGLVRATRDARYRLVAATLWPGIVYFLVHALHDRVQANWPSFLLPAYCLAAAIPFGSEQPRWHWLRTAAAPVAVALLLAVYAQALFGFLPVGRSDPVNRLLGFGIPDVARKLAEAGGGKAAALVVTDYASAGWFSFYRPHGLAVLVLNEPERWEFASPAPGSLLSRPLLYAAEQRLDRSDLVRQWFGQVHLTARIDRSRGSQVIARYIVFRVDQYRGSTPVRKLP
ncbi:MAG: glycosyltransferase family 39 protein [Alphaproteobacteria bacterium]|nr:glycosyltransferase family 39 protein [Alphaproteobacteria bacterium]